MDVVIDTSALIAVVTSAPEKPALVQATRNASLIAPPSVHWEVGNAYLIECARVTKAPLLTLDLSLRRAAADAGSALMDLE